MPTEPIIADLLLQITASLKSVSETPEIEAEMITASVLQISRSKLFAGFRESVSSAKRERIAEIVKQRLQQKPLAYLLGHSWFYEREFIVTPDVLIPRPETEGLVELALKWSTDKGTKPLHVLEIGTGSGCIAITLAAENKNLNIIALDISREALNVASRNKQKLIPDVTNIRFTRQDLFSLSTKEMFDMIISNPPYIPTGSYLSLDKSVRNFEPRLALDGGADGQKYFRKLFELINANLKDGGFACFELDSENYKQTRLLAEEIKGISGQIKILPDLAGRIRYLTLNS